MKKGIALLLLATLTLPVVQAAGGVELAVTTPAPYSHAAARGQGTAYAVTYELSLERAMAVRLCSVSRLAEGSLLPSAVAWSVDGAGQTGSSTNSVCLGDDGSIVLGAGGHQLATTWSFTMPQSPATVGLRVLVREVAAGTGGGSGAGGTTSSDTLEVDVALQPTDVVGPVIQAIQFNQVGRDVTASWETDEDATSSIFVTGGTTAREVQGQGGPRQFTAFLGSLSAGTYQYTIVAHDAQDNEGTASGSFDVQGLDSDGDGASDASDNCPTLSNPDQSDFDGDSAGDACDTDDDDDGVPDAQDAFPLNPQRASGQDLDGDGFDDEFDADDDNDGDLDGSDNCPRTPNGSQADLDGDGLGDACDSDIDGDGVPNSDDAFPRDSSRSSQPPQSPGAPPAPDSDGDGVPNDADNCAAIANADQHDADGDGRGDVCDPDDDGDNVPDDRDAFPFDPERASGADLDGDGRDDEVDADDDGDGRVDASDNCPRLANPSQEDLDGDGQGDSCDDDLDGDGVSNALDAFPGDPTRSQVDDRDEVPVEAVNTGTFVAGPAMLAQLEAAGVALPGGALVFIDSDGDGRNDTVRDRSGILTMRHAAVSQQVFLMQDAAALQVLLLPTLGEVHEATRVAGSIASVRVDEGSRPLEAGQDPVLVTVRVAQKEGWIVVSIPDVAPGTEITSLQRDGQELPLSLVWREGGQVHFLDDPVTEYTLGFNQGDAKPAGASWLLVGAVAAGAVLLVALVVLALRRR